MLTVDQLEILARGVSTVTTAKTAGPMWKDDGHTVVYLGAPGGDLDYWQVNVDTGERSRVTGGLESTLMMSRTGEAHISPDGRWLSCVSAAADKTGQGLEMEIWLYALKGQREPLRLTHLGARISSFGWSRDGGWLAVSSNRYGSYDIYLISVPDGLMRRLTGRCEYEVHPSFSPDGQRIYYVRLNEDWTDHTVCSNNLEGTDEVVLARDEDFFDYQYGRAFGYPVVDPLGRWVVFPSYRTGWINYWRVSVDGGSPQLLAEAQADQTEARWSPDGLSLAYLENYRGNLQLRVLDVETGTVTVIDAEGGGACAGPQWSPDGSRLAYIYQELARPAELRVATLERQTPGSYLVKEVTPVAGPEEPGWIDSLAQPQRVTYETFDGREIDAFLYHPPCNLPGKCPAVVLAHGGPTSQFYETFEHQGTSTTAQYLAQRGYMVLLPNVRGSSGYGREFEDLNNQDWGHGDLADIAYGVKFLQSLEEVDGGSIGITGSSYGGSMVMNAVAFMPDLFQAAVARSGFGDWLRGYDEKELHSVKQMIYKLGPMPENAHVYRRCSPYYQISQIRTPTLVMHGEGKLPRSPDGRRFAEEMKRQMKPVRHSVYQGEGYYIRSVQGRRDALRETADFFDEYLREPGKV